MLNINNFIKNNFIKNNLTNIIPKKILINPIIKILLYIIFFVIFFDKLILFSIFYFYNKNYIHN